MSKFVKCVMSLSLMLHVCAFAFAPNDHFKVVHIQLIDQTKSIHFLADVAGAVQVGSDYRPTTDTHSPLYKFKALTLFLQNDKRMSGYVASIDIINCHDRTFLQGMTWYHIDDHMPPTIIPPKTDFKPIKDAPAFYAVGKELCHW